MTFNLPDSIEPYVDKYFLRFRKILDEIDHDPWIRSKVYFRSSGQIAGMEEALAIIDKYTSLIEKGSVYAQRDGEFKPMVPVLEIIGPAREFFIETVVLGVLSAEVTKKNDNHGIDFGEVEKNVGRIRELIGDRTIADFHARHWRYDETKEISRVAHEAGADLCSTDIGAEVFGEQGVGTIPHVLQGICKGLYPDKNPVIKSLELFDEYIDESVPRVSLVDFRNKEVQDSMMSAKEGADCVRIDTCGENAMEG